MIIAADKIDLIGLKRLAILVFETIIRSTVLLFSVNYTHVASVPEIIGNAFLPIWPKKPLELQFV